MDSFPRHVYSVFVFEVHILFYSPVLLVFCASAFYFENEVLLVAPLNTGHKVIHWSTTYFVTNQFPLVRLRLICGHQARVICDHRTGMICEHAARTIFNHQTRLVCEHEVMSFCDRQIYVVCSHRIRMDCHHRTSTICDPLTGVIQRYRQTQTTQRRSVTPCIMKICDRGRIPNPMWSVRRRRVTTSGGRGATYDGARQMIDRRHRVLLRCDATCRGFNFLVIGNY